MITGVYKISFLVYFILFINTLDPLTIFDFAKNSNLNNWNVVDDGVMGGRSSGQFGLSDEGNAVFKGSISLENNGGFSSVRYRSGTKEIHSYSKFILHLKGDGKKYQFRVKSDTNEYYSYIQYFTTSGDWEALEIHFEEMYPTFRGRQLNQPNFPGEKIEEIGFLFGNKKAESFRLEIDKIEIL